MKYLRLLIPLVLLGCNFNQNETSSSVKKTGSDPQVEGLLAKMTLDEKVAQLQCLWNEKVKLYDSENWFSPDSAKKYVPSGLGQIGRPSENRTPEENARFTNAIQKYFIEETRLGIPVIFHEECLHGHAAPEKTSFSQPIGLASTWNKELVEELYTMTAKEARAVGTHLALTPVVDVAREPRWGRVEETFGEDPYLVGQMGLAAVRGFQGRDGIIKGDHIMATLKHFAAHGQPESGTNAAPVQVSERVLRETFLYPFQLSVQKGYVKNIMASYNEIDGVPSHINSWLLEDVLRKEWGFNGVVVSDYYAIEELNRRHHVATDYDHAGIQSLKAGVDVELPEPVAFKNLAKAVENGQLDIQYIDRAVRRVLQQKFDMGLFDNPYVDVAQVKEKVGLKSHKKLALTAAEETMVLLKNQNSILPLDTTKQITIAVIGPNADRVLLGGYSGEPSYFVTVLDGIKKKFGKNAKILSAQGVKITKDSVLRDGKWIKTAWNVDPVEKSDRAENLKLIKQAKKIALKADVVVLCIGGNEQTSREAWMESHMGDRTDLQLVGEQLELLDELNKTGKPIISLLFNGRPLALGEVQKNSAALIECWYLGSESGNAIANVLSGKVNPSGKLPISFPRSVGHTPSFYNYKPTARRGYLFDEISPLFSFGYGQSYTSFEYSEPQLSASTIATDGSTTISTTVTNTGKMKGKEIIQLYIRDEISSVTRPVKELKAFKKISLEPNEKATVSFEISQDELAFWTINKKLAVEPGMFTLMIGSSSRDEELKNISLTVK